MKSFRYLGLLVAVGLLSACSDNLDENQGNGPGSGDKTPAYLSISIANNGNSTKANTGDGEGTAEDSGLENAGTANENKIASILLVALSEDGTSGYAKLYATSGETVNGWTQGQTPNENTYTSEPIKLGVGTYKILVVANPYAGFVNGFTEATDLTTVKGLYDKIRDGKYVPDGSTINTADDAAGVLATANSGVMMANQQEISKALTENNTPDKPATVTVDIERTVSKITYRQQKVNDVYKVPVAGQVKAKTIPGCNTDDNKSNVTLNVAKDACIPTPNTVYVLIEEDKVAGTRTVTVYGAPNASSEGKYRKLEAKTQSDYNDGTADEKEGWYVVADTEDVEASLTYQFDGTGTTDWYVRLEGYALVNLSKEVYHVRHIQDAHGVPAPFGTLNGNNFLITPYWDDKNEVEFDGDGNFLNNPQTTTWFYNTLAQVSAESEMLTIDNDGNFETGTNVPASYFKSWPNPATPENPGNVEGGTGSNPEVGVRLAYCFENSTDIEHQTHGLSTGITFVARMYKDANCKNPVDKLYQYNGYNFESLAAIGEAFGGNTPQDILDLIAKEIKGEEITKAELKAAKVVKYVGNICYYYSTQIKHYDDGNNNTLGNMEFAIMRNNIYSLAVTNITRLGDPIVDPTPETPNETKEAALQVVVKILPWIVRYNDIEF
ncbi:MAG TPA: fimbria major subunit [Mediterranea massiliensis]|uniref:Fimbria major subunit n=1 Tax=Mediterranea massiliensis TaxID=1841865 RepID=A0A921HX52_9BACT|nr:fimbria major subunit [Mediterranea massiliensis]HJF91342.1 fimbria major subunit [Mediterranea massiliensis]